MLTDNNTIVEKRYEKFLAYSEIIHREIHKKPPSYLEKFAFTSTPTKTFVEVATFEDVDYNKHKDNIVYIQKNNNSGFEYMYFDSNSDGEFVIDEEAKFSYWRSKKPQNIGNPEFRKKKLRTSFGKNIDKFPEKKMILVVASASPVTTTEFYYKEGDISISEISILQSNEQHRIEIGEIDGYNAGVNKVLCYPNKTVLRFDYNISLSNAQKRIEEEQDEIKKKKISREIS